jgi:hypothetical protein
MIPVSEEQVLTVKDGKGREFQLKYLTEIDNQVKYMELTRQEEADIVRTIKSIPAKDIEAIKATVKREVKKEEERPAVISHAIRERAFAILAAERKADLKGRFEFFNAYIDLFVVGWKGGRLLPFSKTEAPSSRLRLFEKYDVYRIVRDNLPELTGLSVDELKN